jgi:importin subunit beta-1
MDLSQILLNAQNPVRDVRAEAEKQLAAAEQQNLPAFLLALCQELASSDKNPHSRRLAGLILKNALDAKDETRKQQRIQQWLALDATTKTHIKAGVIKTLADPAKEARHTAAQVLAKIAVIELPRDQWPDLIEMLMNHMMSSDNNLKESTLEALGYICEEIEPHVIQEKSNQILTAVVQGMRKEEACADVRVAGTTALLNALEFVRANFEKEAERNYILTVVCEATQANVTQIRVAAFECLVKIAALYYDKIGNWMQNIFNITLEAMKKDEELVAQQAVEFWSTVCDVEVDILLEMDEYVSMKEKPPRTCLNYIKGAMKFLIPVLMECLTKQEGEDQDEDAWNVSTAAGTCLALIATTVLDEVVPHVMPFVRDNISSSNWRFREAAVLAFGSILEGPSGYIITELVTQAIPILLQHTKDPVVLVKDTTAWTLGRICQIHSQILTPKLPEVIQVLIEALADEPRIAAKACWAIHNLADAYEIDDKPTSPLSPYFQALAVALLRATDRDDADESFLASSAYEAVNLLIQNSSKDSLPLIAQLLSPFLDRLEKTFATQIVSSEDKEAVIELQGHLCGSLQACTQKLEGEVKPFADRMMTLFLRVFESQSASVQEEALMAVGALANAVEGDFIRYMPTFAKWLEVALRNWEEHSVCVIAVGVVGDICRALGDKVAPYCDALVSLLLENLKNPVINRTVKPPILSCFGDIALAIGGRFEPYLPHVMAMLQQASTTPIPETADYDFVDYVLQLREDIFEAYTSIIQGLRTDNKADLFLRYVEHVVGFVSFVWNDPTKSDEVTRGAVGVLGDLAHALGPKVKDMLRHEIVQAILNECTTSANQQTREVAKWAKQVISRLP